MVFVDILHHHGEVVQPFSNLCTTPGSFSSPETAISIRTQGSKEHIFKQVGGSPDAVVAQCQGCDAIGAESLSDCEEIVEGGWRFKAILIKNSHVVPEHVGAVDVDRNTPDLTLV